MALVLASREPPWRSGKRPAALAAACVVQLALLCALRAGHLEVARPQAETVVDLLAVRAPVAAKPPAAPATPGERRSAPRLRVVPVPAQAASPEPAAAAITATPGASAPSEPPASLDLGAATLRRAIAEAARASGSIAAQAGATTRLSQADRRAQALHEAQRPGCLAPEDRRKPSTSPVHLGGLLALPGLVADAATGQCGVR